MNRGSLSLVVVMMVSAAAVVLVACSSSSSGASGDTVYGAPCKNAGGADPACTGTYNLCAADGPNVICTKACSSGGPGGVASPDCPNPPTSGLCTSKNFCK